MTIEVKVKDIPLTIIKTLFENGFLAVGSRNFDKWLKEKNIIITNDPNSKFWLHESLIFESEEEYFLFLMEWS